MDREVYLLDQRILSDKVSIIMPSTSITKGYIVIIKEVI